MKSVLFALATLAASPVLAAEHSMSGHGSMQAESKAEADVAMAEGKVNRVDADKASVNITHGPIPSFNWPPMSMNLKVADAQILESIATGDQVMFQLKRLSPQEYVIIEMKVKE